MNDKQEGIEKIKLLKVAQGSMKRYCENGYWNVTKKSLLSQPIFDFIKAYREEVY